ncbi:MAG TPA: hypothetical protein VM537_37100 [Anaerolineae bacterium]|nr:hypothetical protein [Anaerolineae bacterium]
MKLLLMLCAYVGGSVIACLVIGRCCSINRIREEQRERMIRELGCCCQQDDAV